MPHIRKGEGGGMGRGFTEIKHKKMVLPFEKVVSITTSTPEVRGNREIDQGEHCTSRMTDMFICLVQ